MDFALISLLVMLPDESLPVAAAASESSVREASAVGRGARQEPAGENTGGSVIIKAPAVGRGARQEPDGENAMPSLS